MDITELILFQHYEQNRAFALLDDIARDDSKRLAVVWSRLVVALEVHAAAEEKFFYPRLLEVGKGAGGETLTGEVKDAIKDHNEIREGIRTAAKHEVGSDAWWDAVEETRKANGDHVGEEEREDLPDFRRNAGLQLRHDVALEFIAYESEHAQGITPKDKDPEKYVKQGG